MLGLGLIPLTLGNLHEIIVILDKECLAYDVFQHQLLVEVDHEDTEEEVEEHKEASYIGKAIKDLHVLRFPFHRLQVEHQCSFPRYRLKLHQCPLPF